MRKLFVALVFLAPMMVLGGAGESSAQVIDLERSRYSPAAAFNYGEEGDITIMANVWGTVRYPGLYEITKGTTLSTLFSLAGGPLVNARETSDDRKVTLRLTRGRQQETVFEFEMDNQVLSLESDPVLEMGDVLTVDTVERRGFSWRDVFPIVAAVASVALAVERVAR